jgi:D-alanine-D-alanine ligase
MRIAVLHQAVTEQDTVEDQDVLVQVECVSQALRQLGHEPAAVPCTLNLEAMLDRLRTMKPDLVFNLVESLGGADSLVYLPYAVLDAVGIPYTGNRTESHFLTANKVLAKKMLRSAGLPTPEWIEDGGLTQPLPPAPTTSWCPPMGEGRIAKWIVKGVWDQASRDLDEEAIVVRTEEGVLSRVRERARRTGRESFAEKFIAGREFNVALLASPNGPEVLPPAEIDFSAFPPEKPRIVGHRAKWDENSFEYTNTPRTFDFPAADNALLEEIRRLTKKCWEIFSLRGWARVDFRVDEDSRPWILEINTNPCLSPDAGFAAALARAKIPFEEAIRRIVEE